MRIFFLEERLAGKGGTKVRKWRSNDGINYDQLMKIKMRMMTSYGSWITQYVLHHIRVAAKSERNFVEYLTHGNDL